jgi:glycosyltransferase involved in cell wall biosynthesis|tara:strand:+ start:1017 stop:1937 length:921 start_codon:yes stop_codon:yes gene_type:complete
MKIYLNKAGESWVVDRFRQDWYKHNSDISTKSIFFSDSIWIISPWTWRNLPKRYLQKKLVICTIHHIDFKTNGSIEEKEFYKRDQYVDIYHVISSKTEEELKKITNKKIFKIPFWVDSSIWFFIEDKINLRKKYKFDNNDYLIGSFQRDTEGHDLKSPKLIKGPDIFLEISKNIYNKNKNLKVVLAGKRRNYLINQLELNGIPYAHFEMIPEKGLNELYNLLDLYIVSSRIEGGPQAIVESSIVKTPIVSTDVGIAKEILHPDSIYTPEKFFKAKANIKFAYENTKELLIPQGMEKFRRVFLQDEN